jgi:large subunit ribosomal protein L18
MKILEIKKRRQIRRKYTIRKKIFGTQERLRLSIFKSLKHIYAQLIDDANQKTLVAASTMDKDVIAAFKPEMKKTDKSKLVGSILAKRAVEKNIKLVAFDRNGFLYHGRVKALADGARESGLEF